MLLDGLLLIYNCQTWDNGPDGIRPVISLSSKVKLTGDGTYNNIYTVS